MISFEHNALVLQAFVRNELVPETENGKCVFNYTKVNIILIDRLHIFTLFIEFFHGLPLALQYFLHNLAQVCKRRRKIQQNK